MLCVCWLLAVVVVYVCSPAVGELCWDNSACKDLSSKNSQRICFHRCPSMFLNAYPGLSALVQSSDEERLSLGVLLGSLTSKRKVPESDPSSRSEERRATASYSMEHFRWGKPTLRKRRPIKVYSVPLEDDESTDSFDLQARRQVGSMEDEGNRDVDLQRLYGQESHESSTPKPASLLIPQDRNPGTYRMSHFRWGSPTAKKRKPWEKRSQKPVPKQFRDIITHY